MSSSCEETEQLRYYWRYFFCWRWRHAANNGNNGNKGSNEGASPEASAPAATASATPDAAAAADPLGKYASADRSVRGSTHFRKARSLTKENRSTTTSGRSAYRIGLGMKINYLWDDACRAIRPEAQYRHRFDDLPDIMPVNAAQLKRMVDEMASWKDLTSALRSTTDRSLRRTFCSAGRRQRHQIRQPSTAKLYALPNMTSGQGHIPCALGADRLAEEAGPARAQDDGRRCQKTAEAFVKQDPDGNGKADTYGLGINKDIFGVLPVHGRLLQRLSCVSEHLGAGRIPASSSFRKRACRRPRPLC